MEGKARDQQGMFLKMGTGHSGLLLTALSTEAVWDRHTCFPQEAPLEEVEGWLVSFGSR